MQQTPPNAHRDALMAVCQQFVAHRLLPVGYGIDGEDRADSVKRIINETRNEILAGRLLEAEMLTGVLNALAHDLNDIKLAEPKIYAALIKRVRKSIGNTDFHGLRNEVAMAAVLIRQGQIIVGMERPDFQLADDFSIECGSARVSKRETLTIDDICRKLRAVVEAKDKKDYASSGTALFVDVTNITFFQVRSDSILIREDYVEAATHANAKFGSIVFTSTLADMDARKLRRLWVRIDRETISAGLKAYLEKYYHFGNSVHIANALVFPEAS